MAEGKLAEHGDAERSQDLGQQGLELGVQSRLVPGGAVEERPALGGLELGRAVQRLGDTTVVYLIVERK